MKFHSSRRFAALFLTVNFLLLTCCEANDSAFSGVSGTPKPMKGEHPSVVMQSEKIVISANDKTYDTVVDFIFRNDGAATTVPMGFPENSFGDVEAEKKSAFLKFATFVDGRKFVAKRVKTTQDDSPEVESYWLKTVPFGAHQTRKIRVAYTSPMGGTTEWGRRTALVYDFTGKNWKGKVERSDLEIRVSKPGLWIGMPSFDNGPLAMTLESKPNRAVWRKTWRNWQAQGSFMFGLSRAVPFWMENRDHNMLTPAMFATARTFRVGKVPAELPVGAEAPDAFARNGTTYISLSHLENELKGFASDLEKYRQLKVPVSLKFDFKSRQSRLQAGQTTLFFEPNHQGYQIEFPPDLKAETHVARGLGDLGAPTFLLRGEYGSTLYVPFKPLAKILGIVGKFDLDARLFDLQRGSWTGQ